MDKRLLTVKEVAQALGLGRTRVYELINRGEIQSLTFGRSRRIPVHALNQLVGAASLPSAEVWRAKEKESHADDRKPIAWLESGRLVIDIAALRKMLPT